jgi:hypothetical protein
VTWGAQQTGRRAPAARQGAGRRAKVPSVGHRLRICRQISAFRDTSAAHNCQLRRAWQRPHTYDAAAVGTIEDIEE